MSIAVPQIAEVWQRDSDRTVLLRVAGGWVEPGDAGTLTDDDMVGVKMRRLLTEEGYIAPERLLGVHGLVVEG